MSIRVDRDGKIVPLFQGTTLVHGNPVPIGFSEVMHAGTVLTDDQVEPDLLERIKADEVTGLSWHEEDDPGPPPGAFSADVPEVPGGAAGANADTFDPGDHNQEAVLEYLKDADEAEVIRVQEAEAGGQNRQKIANFEFKSE